MQDEQIRILCQHAVKYAPNGISAEAVADALGMRYATLMSQLSAQPGHKLGAEIVLPIMQVTGSAAPMHHLARQMGGVYVELPPVSPGGHEVTASLVESVRQFGEFAAQVAQSLDDGIITAEELYHEARTQPGMPYEVFNESLATRNLYPLCDVQRKSKPVGRPRKQN